MPQRCSSTTNTNSVLRVTLTAAASIMSTFFLLVAENCSSESTPMPTADYLPASDVSTDGASPANESASNRSEVDVYTDPHQTLADAIATISDSPENSTNRRQRSRRRHPADKTTSLDVGLGRTGSIRSTGIDMWSELGSSRSSNVTSPDRSRTGDGTRSMSAVNDGDGGWTLGHEVTFAESASVEQESPATRALEEGEDTMQQQQQQQQLEPDKEWEDDDDIHCEVKLRACPACWITLQIEVRKRSANSTWSEANDSGHAHSDKTSSFAESVRGRSDSVGVEEDWDEYKPLVFNCELCIDSILIYEPAYGSDDPATSLSLVAEDMDLLTSSSALDDDDVTGRWNYTSMTSSLVVKLSSTFAAFELSSEDRLLQCRRVIFVRFKVVEARLAYSGRSGQTIAIESPRFPASYATGNGDTVTYILTHSADDATEPAMADSHGYLSVTFDDWNLTAGSCIDICDREEVTDCMVVQRFCWNDRRPVFETTSKSLYVAFSTAVDDPSPLVTTIVTSSTSRDVIIGFRATVYFRDFANRTSDSCPPTYTDCGSTFFDDSGRPLIVQFPDRTSVVAESATSSGQYVDCLWLVLPPSIVVASPSGYVQQRPTQRLQIVTASVASDVYAISIHDGLISTSPLVASVWGSVDPRSPHRCSNGTRLTHVLPRPSGKLLPSGTAVTGSRGFYVRLQGIVHSTDNLTFVCERLHPSGDLPSSQLTAAIISDDEPNQLVAASLLSIASQKHQQTPTSSTPGDAAGSSSGSIADTVVRCYNDMAAVGCAHLLMPVGFAVTLLWIGALWMVVRLLHRRRGQPIDPRRRRQYHQLHQQTTFGQCECTLRRQPTASGFRRLPTSSHLDEGCQNSVYSITRDVTMLSVASSASVDAVHGETRSLRQLAPPTYDEALKSTQLYGQEVISERLEEGSSERQRFACK